MRIDKLLAPALLAVAIAACVDSPVGVPDGDARIVFTSEFSFAGAGSSSLPIDEVRVTPRFWPGGAPAGEPTRTHVGHDDEEFVVEAIVDLGERDSATIEVLVELLSTTDGVDVVAWSGFTQPIHVVADEETPAQEPVELIRGPIENALVDSILAFGPSYLPAGASHPAHAVVFTSGTSHTVVWSTSDPDVLGVDPVGDSVEVHAVSGGYAWVYAGAGAHVDSFQVYVDSAEAGPVAFVFAYPDSAVMVVGATRTWQAFATDSTGFPVFGATFTWSSLDEAVATVDASGVVTAEALGRARIVVTSNGISDTAIVNVEELPAGVDLIWQGGAAGFEEDWFTADNWSPARVPTPTDVIYIPSGSNALTLNANAEVGGILADSIGGYVFDIGSNTLTVHGDLRAFWIFGDSGTSRIVMDGAGATLWSYDLPSLTVTGHVTLVGDVSLFNGGDLVVDGTGDGASFDVTDEFFAYVTGDLSVINATLAIAQDDSLFSYGGVYVEGDVLFDGGNSSSSLSGGDLGIGGDFTVTAATCTAFSPTGTGSYMVSDTATVSIGCSSASGNRFWGLDIYQNNSAVERVLELDTDVYVLDRVYFDGGTGTRVVGNGNTLFLQAGNGYSTTFDNAFIEVDVPDAFDQLYLDSVTFTGMTGATRPQLVYRHPGDACTGCYTWMHVIFDANSDGPYIELIDTNANGDSVIIYNYHNPGDGPARSVTTGEAAVYWRDVPQYLFYWSGSGQSGTQHQPLPDSLAVEMLDYGFYPIEDASVDWTVTVGDGSVSPTSSLTDSIGVARTQYTMGDTAFATQQVIATSAEVPADTVVFFLFPTPTPPAGVAAQPERSIDAAQPVRRSEPRVEARREWPKPTRPVPGDMPAREGGSR